MPTRCQLGEMLLSAFFNRRLGKFVRSRWRQDEIPSGASRHFVAVAMASRVDALLGGGDFDALAGHLDALELETGASADWPWAAHVLAHVALGNLDHARFAYQRAPEDAKEEGSELDAALAVLQCAWQRDHAGVHAAAASGAWSPRVAPLVRHVAARHCANTLELMSARTPPSPSRTSRRASGSPNRRLRRPRRG